MKLLILCVISSFCCFELESLATRCHRVTKLSPLPQVRVVNPTRVNHSMRMSTSEAFPSTAPVSSEKKLATKSTLRPSVINLAKNCIGAGVFSIHSRVATSSGTLPLGNVGILIYVMASWATYNFYIIGEACRITNTTSYSDAWAKVVSEKSRWLVQSVVVVAPIVSCLANVIVLTDVLRLLLQSVGTPAEIYANRNVVITILGSVILYPICIQSNLSGLKSVSTLGLAGHFVAMAALAARLWDKSYFSGGQFHAAYKALPIISSQQIIKGISVPILAKWSTLASLLSYCFVTHYNAPKYYSELDGKDRNSRLLGLLPLLAYTLAGSVYLGTTLLTLYLFGTRSQLFALNGFSSADPLGIVARVSFGMSVLASFPLIFLAMRNWFVIQAKAIVPSLGEVKRMTALLLFGICLIATKCTDIGLVGSIAGGLLGSSMMFIFPPIMYMRAVLKHAQEKKVNPPYIALTLNTFLLVLGTCLGTFGTVNSVMAAFRS